MRRHKWCCYWRRTICLCTWAMCLQRGHGRRWRRQRREVRATLSAPFDVNEGSWPLRKRGDVHANFLGELTVDVALHHHYQSTSFVSFLRLARARVITLTISTGACDVSLCVRLHDLASNRGGRAVGRDNRSTRFLSCDYRPGPSGGFDVPPCMFAGPRAELRWTAGGTWSLNRQLVRYAATGGRGGGGGSVGNSSVCGCGSAGPRWWLWLCLRWWPWRRRQWRQWLVLGYCLR